MLPAWETVTLALGGSIVTGIAALMGVFLQGARERASEWRRLVFDTLVIFSTTASRSERALLRTLVARPQEMDVFQALSGKSAFREDLDARLLELSDLSDALNIAWDRLRLVLGPDSKAGATAEHLLDELETAIVAAKKRDAVSMLHAALAITASLETFQQDANLVLHRPPRRANKARRPTLVE